jgi:hypothetical protein
MLLSWLGLLRECRRQSRAPETKSLQVEFFFTELKELLSAKQSMSVPGT